MEKNKLRNSEIQLAISSDIQEMLQRLVTTNTVLIDKLTGKTTKRFTVDNVPGTIENRVFIGGSYKLMPILREIALVVEKNGFQPILAYEFDIPFEKIREYTLRLLFQCGFAIFEETIEGGQLAEICRASGFPNIKVLQIFMATDEKKEPPMSVMVWQIEPIPQGYLTISELKRLVQDFLNTP